MDNFNDTFEKAMPEAIKKANEQIEKWEFKGIWYIEDYKQLRSPVIEAIRKDKTSNETQTTTINFIENCFNDLAQMQLLKEDLWIACHNMNDVNKINSLISKKDKIWLAKMMIELAK